MAKSETPINNNLKQTIINNNNNNLNQTINLWLELPVIYKIYGGRKYLDRLDELIHGSETAKRALREKDEGILIDGQKKRKSTKKDKDSLKKQKK